MKEINPPHGVLQLRRDNLALDIKELALFSEHHLAHTFSVE